MPLPELCRVWMRPPAWSLPCGLASVQTGPGVSAPYGERCLNLRAAAYGGSGPAAPVFRTQPRQGEPRGGKPNGGRGGSTPTRRQPTVAPGGGECKRGLALDHQAPSLCYPTRNPHTPARCPANPRECTGGARPANRDALAGLPSDDDHKQPQPPRTTPCPPSWLQRLQPPQRGHCAHREPDLDLEAANARRVKADLNHRFPHRILNRVIDRRPRTRWSGSDEWYGLEVWGGAEDLGDPGVYVLGTQPPV